MVVPEKIMWLWPLATFENRIQGGVAAAARLEIDFWGFTAGDKRCHQISQPKRYWRHYLHYSPGQRLEQESQKRTKIKKICSVVDCWYTAKLTRSRAVKQDWFVHWNTGNKHRQNNNNNIASASSSQKINPIKILNWPTEKIIPAYQQ